MLDAIMDFHKLDNNASILCCAMIETNLFPHEERGVKGSIPFLEQHPK